MFFKKDKKGFALIEIMVALAVFTLFALGIYSGIQFVFKVVHQSRLRILETAILNEQVEIIRNLSFYDVGIINGSPSGLLERDVSLTRGGIDFIITRTIRNIDDPFDGIAGGNPNDAAPADYKLVDVEIICTACRQNNPLRMATFVAPKFLEGDPTHGALFIQVFDAEGVAVQGASVHIVATSTDPTLDMTDTTDNDGMLRLLDLAEGVNAYNITATKDGYTSDQTIMPSESNPNPVKNPVSVIAQDVTEISFSIDEVAYLNIQTINNVCNDVPNALIDVIGTKLLGTEPDVYKMSETINSGASAEYIIPDLEWDSYSVNPPWHDLLGSIPQLPINLLPGTTQPVKLILGADTAHSLLVHVQDSVTGQPVSSASVHVSGVGYDNIETTGVGHLRQTDWSGGPGQQFVADLARYWSDDGKLEIASPAGDVKLRQVGGYYVADGMLESSIFDSGTNANYVNLVWEPLAQPAEVGADAVRWQIATSPSSTPETWTYLGPDATSGSYYDPTSAAINEVHNGGRYFRYKLYLSTASTTFTPTISDISINYTNSCTPPGQAYFGNLNDQEYSTEVSADGYDTQSSNVTIDGNTLLTVDLIETI